MANKHKHYDMIVEWAKNTSRTVQWSRTGRDDHWYDCTIPPQWDDNHMYRFKPEEVYVYLLKYNVVKNYTSTSKSNSMNLYTICAYSDSKSQMEELKIQYEHTLRFSDLTKAHTSHVTNLQMFKVKPDNGIWKEIEQIPNEDISKIWNNK